MGKKAYALVYATKDVEETEYSRFHSRAYAEYWLGLEKKANNFLKIAWAIREVDESSPRIAPDSNASQDVLWADFPDAEDAPAYAVVWVDPGRFPGVYVKSEQERWHSREKAEAEAMALRRRNTGIFMQVVGVQEDTPRIDEGQPNPFPVTCGVNWKD